MLGQADCKVIHEYARVTYTVYIYCIHILLISALWYSIHELVFF